MFARSVVRLLRDIDRRRALEAAARTLVVDRYDWSAVAGELEDALIRFATCQPNPAAASEAAINPSGRRRWVSALPQGEE